MVVVDVVVVGSGQDSNCTGCIIVHDKNCEPVKYVRLPASPIAVVVVAAVCSGGQDACSIIVVDVAAVCSGGQDACSIIVVGVAAVCSGGQDACSIIVVGVAAVCSGGQDACSIIVVDVAIAVASLVSPCRPWGRW